MLGGLLTLEVYWALLDSRTNNEYTVVEGKLAIFFEWIFDTMHRVLRVRYDALEGIYWVSDHIPIVLGFGFSEMQRTIFESYSELFVIFALAHDPALRKGHTLL